MSFNGLTVGSTAAGKQTQGVTAGASTVSVAAKSGSVLSIVLPAVTKGSKVTATIKTPGGSSINLPTTTASSNGSYKLPAIKFSKSGTYTITALVGKIKKVITITVR
jgi:hypothetical protein